MIETFAHPNVALIKYWGKRHDALRIPSTPSLSIPLLSLETRTKLKASPSGKDEVIIEGQRDASLRVERWLALLRSDHALEVPALTIESSSNFPTSAGLASSASGFAALAKGVNQFLGLDLREEALSRLARLGSASAARSLATGFVALEGVASDHQSWHAREIKGWESWPLGVCVALCSRHAKPVSSSEGMRLGRESSAAYKNWLGMNQNLFRIAEQSIDSRDFETLAWASRWSFFGMLSVMASTHPALAYLNENSLAVIKAIDELHSQGAQVFFTCDAGAQVKCVYLPEFESPVRSRLEAIPGVLDVLRVSP